MEAAPDPREEHADAIAGGPAHRRAAGLNPGNRFERTRRHASADTMESDRLAADPADAAKPHRVPLTVLPDATRTVLNRVVPVSDVPFDWTLNPYRGCEHGCIYCYARPYHEYLGFSAGLDFETKLVAKHDAPELLARELASPRWKPEPIVMSAITDVYQPLEARLGLTRRCLEVLAAARQPVATLTKSRLVLRDLDLWQELASCGAGRVTVTLVTLDDDLAGRLEPRASPPGGRLRLIRELSDAGVRVTVNVAPVIPGLTDHEVPAILEAVAEAGATSVAWSLLRLPHQVKALFLDWLRRSVHPSRAGRVEAAIRATQGGKLYDSRRMGQRDGRGSRYRGEGPAAEQVAQVFRVFMKKHRLGTCGRHGTDALADLSGGAFRRPQRPGSQRGLFD
ncbi:PA0069 family radical SAM protein [Phycisphaera mikurensis]|uniref:Elp3/MiaA/NifB-like radical SAM core domain-containing protein n=1 Tax=Phycisphaera mikurensis (strain NBRC 102666 / KCTC 22515 / FYK2301M01) TaxID=1142394 RepID=I0IAI2_PHYMF|nr:PA0069 family radical SAM protein [Phycisphaera mikurensis]MBB6441733.1 DNA repair photolyase [Phycisphaera mikurensis]BAM02270.1 hypothetical protein PSMK_01110 [Phycisphaera mikurensis NBRC 102666]